MAANESPVDELFENYNKLLSLIEEHHKIFSEADEHYPSSGLGLKTKKTLMEAGFVLDKLGIARTNIQSCNPKPSHTSQKSY